MKDLEKFFEELEDEDFGVPDEELDLPHRDLIYRVLVETGEVLGLKGNYLSCSSYSYREAIPPIDKLDVGEDHITGPSGQDEHIYVISIEDPPQLLEFLCPNPTIRIRIRRGNYSDTLQIDVELCKQSSDWYASGRKYAYSSEKLLRSFSLKNEELTDITAKS